MLLGSSLRVSNSESYGQRYEDDARTYAYEHDGYNLLATTVTTEREMLDLNVKWMSFVPKGIQLITSKGNVGLEEFGGTRSYEKETQELKLQVPNTFVEPEIVVQGQY